MKTYLLLMPHQPRNGLSPTTRLPQIHREIIASSDEPLDNLAAHGRGGGKALFCFRELLFPGRGHGGGVVEEGGAEGEVGGEGEVVHPVGAGYGC